MAQVSLFLDTEDLDAANASSQFTFIVPPDAAVKGNLKDPSDEKARASWQQTLEVVSSKMYEDVAKDAKGNEYPAIVIELELAVQPNAIRSKTGEADPNAGRKQRVWYRVVPAALKNSQHPKYKANNFALAQANGILRSIWGEGVFPRGQGVHYEEYYGEVNGTVAVVGQTVNCTVKQSRYEGKLQDQFTDFVPLELREA